MTKKSYQTHASTDRFYFYITMIFTIVSPVQTQAEQWIFSGPGGGPVSCLTAETIEGKVLYAGGRGGIWKSIDSGDSWRFLPNSPAPAEKIAIDMSNKSVIYAGQDEGVYRSEDAGMTWAQILGPFGPGVTRKLTGLVAGPSSVYASFDNTIDPGGGPLYRSTDTGKNWTSLNPVYGSIPGITIRNLEIDQFIPRILYIMREYWLCRSEDNGQTCSSWSYLGIGNSSKIYSQRDGEAIIYGFGAGIVRSNDWFSQWFSATGSGLDLVHVNSLVTDQAMGNGVLAGTDNGVFRGYYPYWMWEAENTGLGNGYDALKINALAPWNVTSQ